MKETPWITYKAVQWLDNYLDKNMIMFEYGSGDSTLYFSERVKKIVSVEHNKIWYDKIYKKLTASGMKNWDYFNILPDKLEFPIDYFPGSYSSKSGKDHARTLSFEKYVKFIEIYHDHFFDFIFIDGRSRASCVQYALNKIKKGGYLMLDNSDRKHYEYIFTLMSAYEKTDFWGYGKDHEYWNTTIWKVK